MAISDVQARQSLRKWVSGRAELTVLGGGADGHYVRPQCCERLESSGLSVIAFSARARLRGALAADGLKLLFLIGRREEAEYHLRLSIRHPRPMTVVTD